VTVAVVVTGAAGFIGRHLVSALTARGLAVTGIDRRGGMPTAATALIGDLNDADNADIAHALRDADAVFHLAAFPGVRASGRLVEHRRRLDNVAAAARVLDLVPLRVPLVVTSSSSVYGGSTGRGCAEEDVPNPRGSYARSKLDVERLCARRVSHGGHVAVARPFTVAGEGQRPDMAISRWIAAAQRGEPLTIYGSGDRSRDITDVHDVVEGLVRILDRNVRATVNLGTGVGQRLDAVAAAVAAAVGRDVRTVIVPAAAVEPPATLADIRRCERLLEFVPRTDIDGLVRRQLTSTLVAAGAA
jgi:nucleoside-diphosphate-sugar epimerase